MKFYFCLLLMLAPAGAAEIAKAGPGPSARIDYVISSVAGRNGTVSRWRDNDGRERARIKLLLRGKAWDFEETARIAKDGTISSFERHGTSPEGRIDERFDGLAGQARWTSPIDQGRKSYTRPAFYKASGTLPTGIVTLSDDLTARWFAAHSLLSQVELLPAGTQRMKRLTRVAVGRGANARKVTLWEISGVYNLPLRIWTDAQGNFFASVDDLRQIRMGYEGEVERLLAVERDFVARRSAQVARQFPAAPDRPVAFRNVRIMAEGGQWRDAQTVIVNDGRIAAVGPVATVAVPANAREIDGSGKTLLPGLWDAHRHFSDDAIGPIELSMGVTSIRDPGTIETDSIDRRRRRANGTLLAPHPYSSLILDGPSPNASQTAVIVHDAAEGVSIVRRAKSEGFFAIKIYGSLDPALVAPIAKEAHRLGMHVHGHVPAGMRPSEAIAAGYDELTHIYFISMEAMPDDVVDHSNGSARFTGTGRLMKDVDLDRGPIDRLVKTMAARGIEADPTLVVPEAFFVPEKGELEPADAAWVGLLPAAVERDAKRGGFAPPAGATRADYRASFAKLSALVKKMFDAGIPVVAGTDSETGIELVHELELYVAAGITNTQAIEAATIVPARLVGADGHTGSIKVGKDADLVLVDGDPSVRIGDLRHVRTVLMDGRLMDADKLRAIAGFARMPQ